MNELSQEARALIDSVSKLDDPSAEDRARVKQRLALSLGAAAFTAVAATQLAGGAGSGWFAGAKGGLLGTASKLALCAGVLGGAVAIGWPDARAPLESTHAPRQIQPPSSAAVEPAANAALQAPAAAAPVITEAPPASAAAPAEPVGVKRAAVARKAAAQSPAAAKEQSSLGLELALLAEAQAALRAGQPARALALAQQHQQRFPAGVMREERLGIEALSECDLGRRDPAHAEAFLRAAPDSPLAARVRKACGLE